MSAGDLAFDASLLDMSQLSAMEILPLKSNTYQRTNSMVDQNPFQGELEVDSNI